MTDIPNSFDLLITTINAQPEVAVLLRITILLGLGWIVNLILLPANPRWRTLLWRTVAASTVVVALACLLPPAFELKIEQRAEGHSGTPTASPSPTAPEYSRSVSSSAMELQLVREMQERIVLDPAAADAPVLHETQGASALPYESAMPASPPDGNPSWKDRWNTWNILSAIWLMGIVALLLRFYLGKRRLGNLIARATAATTAIVRETQRVAEELRCSVPIRVALSDEISTPMITGIFRPILLLPHSLHTTEYERDLQAILAHEISHVASHDLAWSQILYWLSVALWFHPLAWRMGEAHLRACEETSDAMAAEFMGDARAYSKVLARIVVNLVPSHVETQGIAMARMSDVTRRIALLSRHLFAARLSRRKIAGFVTGALVVGVALGSVGVVLAEKKTDSKASLEETADSERTVPIIHDAVIPIPEGVWHQSPALADLDGDGDLEIILGTSAWHHDGRAVAGWSGEHRSGASSAAVGDMDGDGRVEVAYAGLLMQSDGSPLPGWPADGRPNTFCTPCLDDVDGDGKLEILYTDIQKGVCISRIDGTMLPGWPVSVSDNDVRTTPMAYDVDQDGQKEIIFIHSVGGEIRVHRLDGSLFKSFSKRGLDNLRVGGTFVLADVDNDGRKEMILGNKAFNLMNGETMDFSGNRGGQAPCLVRDEDSGQLMQWGCSLPGNALLSGGGSGAVGYYTDSAVAGDIDGDGMVEILFGTREGSFYAYRKDGSQAAGWPKQLTQGGDCGQAIGDLDGDGDLEVVIPTGGGKMYVFDCPGKSDTPAPWPLYLGSNLRDGTPDLKNPLRASTLKVIEDAGSTPLSDALKKGEWDKAIEIYRQADSAVQHDPDRQELHQGYLLSIARILKNRAQRPEQAADYYRQAVHAAPESWLSCQAMLECTDLLELNPSNENVRDMLGVTLEDCFPVLPSITGDYLNLYQLAMAKACLLTDKKEKGLELLRGLTAFGNGRREPGAGYAAYSETNAASLPASTPASRPSQEILRLASSLERYEGLPFLLSFEEKTSIHVDCRERDLVPGASVEAETLYQLEINPHSATGEAFPIELNLTAANRRDVKGEKGWKKSEDGKMHKAIKADLPSGDLGTYRCNRETLRTIQSAPNLVTVRREVEQIDATHQKVKIFFQTALPRVEYGFEIFSGKAKIDPKSVVPSEGAMYLNESEVRFSTTTHNARAGVENAPDLKKGVTVEAVVELPPGGKMFYPAVTVRAWGGGDAIAVTPRDATHKIQGTFGGIDYSLASTRQFKLAMAATNIFCAYTLQELIAPSDATTEKPANASTTRTMAGGSSVYPPATQPGKQFIPKAPPSRPQNLRSNDVATSAALALIPGKPITHEQAQAVVERLKKNVYLPQSSVTSLVCEFEPQFVDKTAWAAMKMGEELDLMAKGRKIGTFAGMENVLSSVADDGLSSARKAVFYYSEAQSNWEKGILGATVLLFDAQGQRINVHPIIERSMAMQMSNYTQLMSPAIFPRELSKAQQMQTEWRLDEFEPGNNILSFVIRPQANHLRIESIAFTHDGLLKSTERLFYVQAREKLQSMGGKRIFKLLPESKQVGMVAWGEAPTQLTFEWTTLNGIPVVERVGGMRPDFLPDPNQPSVTPWEIRLTNIQVNPEVPADVLQALHKQDTSQFEKLDLSSPDATIDTLIKIIRTGQTPLFLYCFVDSPPIPKPLPQFTMPRVEKYWYDTSEYLRENLKIISKQQQSAEEWTYTLRVPRPLRKAKEIEVKLKQVNGEWRIESSPELRGIHGSD